MVDADENAPKKPHRRAGDADVLALAEGLLMSLGRTFDRGDIEVLKTVAESYPDIGRDGAGEVVASLKGLLADFLADQTYDREAIAVHVRAWRFMVSRKPDRKERVRILAGLADVRTLYADAKAA
ncbi:hypothetical protein [Phenylobacterium sp.]|uniref:hypothetical protein n=1 Tax=Phenylobacterium sp. TaxID=1871053 RepID=UPI0025F3108F|nr:hypothetical protein [Phenylobacterium sp.]MBX3482831.1 hypothetical protein [Phenylobacterium sp.]MCW5758567.1 hypothetical protein [Phenylobacterium sp.]